MGSALCHACRAPLSRAREAILLEAAMSLLAAWATFYVIIGSSAGTLTGLMFVVSTLLAGTQRPASRWSLGAFSTPTVAHFGVVLLVAALLSAPWPALTHVAILLGLVGLGGVLYIAIVVRRLRRRDVYEPIVEDWVWYAFVPLVAYATLIVAAILLPGNPSLALFAIGAVLVVLLFVGIRNAWDLATFIAVELLQPPNEGET